MTPFTGYLTYKCTMSPAPALFEFGTRKFICNSCLAALRKRSTVTPWPIRQLSQVADARAPTRPKQRSPEQEAERLKTLDTLGLLKDNADKISVNYFEQGEGGSIRRLQDANEFNQALVDPGGELDARLKEFEDQLRGVTNLAKAIEEMGGKEEADRLRKQFDDSNPDDLLDELDHTPIPALAIPISGLKSHSQHRINKLNAWIKRCSKALEKNAILPNHTQGLWRTYSAARTALSGRFGTVPGPTWELLWKVLSSDYAFNVNCLSHIYFLAKDMQSAGISLRPEQQLLALEAIFVDGWKNEAIENHRRHASTLGADPETFVRFWELGLQMYCRAGDLERAERIASKISESPYEANPRFIQPLIKLYAETPGTVETGFKLYRDLRVNLGDSMTIEDYDTIISYFLASGNTEYALFIFVDMMKSGSVDLLGVQHYPPSIANPFFFGKWLKRLIGAGDFEGAFNVTRLMRSHGITPRAIQVNGLIGAWLRSGVVDNARKAEDVAWAMINARIQFVELRRRESALAGVSLYPSGDGWPRANLETFSLLAENYRERGLTTKMGPLWQSFQEAKIASDPFLMNQLLLSLFQEGKGDTVQSTYEKWIKEFKFEPDSHTFMILWQALPANRFTSIRSLNLSTETSRTRALFAEMVKHMSIFKSKDGPAIDNFLARNMFHSFRKIRDRVGLLLAYRALRRILDYNPPDMVVFELLLGTQDLERLGKRREGSKLIQARMSLDHYLVHRHRELEQSGEIKAGEEMPPEIRSEETGNYLELQLESALSDEERDEAQHLFIEAAKEMGLQTGASQEAEGGDVPS
ncbi:hypothetical protein F4861DRAFT_523896 [Xylaria intraflava]|nr:hypothetical protein F4861DRAFT_523896 [Xylaria intraflava]